MFEVHGHEKWVSWRSTASGVFVSMKLLRILYLMGVVAMPPVFQVRIDIEVGKVLWLLLFVLMLVGNRYWFVSKESVNKLFSMYYY